MLSARRTHVNTNLSANLLGFRSIVVQPLPRLMMFQSLEADFVLHGEKIDRTIERDRDRQKRKGQINKKANKQEMTQTQRKLQNQHPKQ